LPGYSQLQAFETLNRGLLVTTTPTATPLTCASTMPSASSSMPVTTACYGRHARFRELIAPMCPHALQLKELERDHPDVQKRMAVTELAAKRDEELCDTLEDLWFAAGAWPIKGIEPNRQRVEINGSPFHCHGYIAELDAWVVLGFDPA
jgi:hypothetical protein